jgi:DNA-binding NtrC family response regulator
MNAPSKILVASPELQNRRALVNLLNEKDWSTISVSRVRDCLEVLTTLNVSMIFCERLLADGDYRDLRIGARPQGLDIPMVVTSRSADWDEYRQALHHGAFDLIPSPSPREDVFRAVSQAKLDRLPPPTPK